MNQGGAEFFLKAADRMSAKRTIVLVSSTHWDPEWYSTYQEYRIRLVRLVDKLLDIMENDGAYRQFMFDGQVSAIMDYLDVRPEGLERIRRLVRRGRLLVGPWWILPEEFMPSAESHVRNLMLGRKEAMALGGMMNVSYLCDMPGHVSQMPQILRGFGIEANAAWRGIKGYPGADRSLFNWQSPDGSSVLMVYMANGYGGVGDLSSETDPIAKIEAVAAAEAAMAPARCVLVMNGGDHIEPDRNLPEIIRRFNRVSRTFRAVHGSLPQYVAMVKKTPGLKIHRGELFSAAPGSQIFASGNLATRMRVKIAMRECEAALEQWAEPFAAIERLLGGPDQRPLLRRSWRYLLQNNFHDVVYGGHVDGVAIDALNRAKASREIAHCLAQESLYRIARRIDTRGASSCLVVFNSLACGSNVTGEFDFYDDDFAAPSRRGRDIAFLDESGRLVPLQVLERQKAVRLTTGMGIIERNMAVPSMRYRVCVGAGPVAGLGYAAMRAAWLPPAEIQSRMPRTDLVVRPRWCENNRLKVIVNRNGAIDIVDKAAGNVYRNLNHFEDSGDAGDQYFFGPPRKNRVLSTLQSRARIVLCRKGPVVATYKITLPFKVPADSSAQARSARKVVCRITTFVSLQAGSGRVDIRTEIDNRAKNHRIRAVFPTGIACRFSSADSVFDVVRRPNCLKIRQPWMEKEAYYPQRLFMSLGQGARGFTLINRGLPQFQVGRRGKIHLTLMRCVSHLIKHRLPGWNIANGFLEKWPTPATQEIGVQSFSYAIYPHAGDWRAARSRDEALAFNAGFRSVQVGEQAGTLPLRAALMRSCPAGLAVSALKPAEDGRGVILRLFNVTGERVRGSVVFRCMPRVVSEVDLKEDPAPRRFLVRREPDRLILDVLPHKIVSLRLA